MNFGKAHATGDPRRNVYLSINDLYCGCGQPWAAVELIHDLLRAAPFYENQDRLTELLPTPGIKMLVLEALDKAQLIEHGGSIGGSWLTERGREALAGLDEISQAEGYEAFDDEIRCVHGFCPEDDHECRP